MTDKPTPDATLLTRCSAHLHLLIGVALCLPCLRLAIAGLFRGGRIADRTDVAWFQIATEKPVPFIYKRGDRGPKQADERLAALGFMRTHNYVGPRDWGK